MSTAFRVTVVAAALLLAACGGRKAKPAKAPRIGSTENGIASWYGHPYHGRRAANGEIYDMEQLTAAHRTLPFETWVRVRNLANGKTVDVRIQDRGPFVRGRIIDLSHAGARAIDLVGPGTAKVRLTIIAPPKYLARQPELFGVQVGAFQEKSRAEAWRDSMQARYGKARIIGRQAEPPVWRVVVGEEETMDAALTLAGRIRSDGSTGFVVRIDNARPATD